MAFIPGTDGHDNNAFFGKSLIGTNAGDMIYGYGGNDLLDGRDGHDALFGGAGFDIIKGGKGNDLVYNGTGNGSLDGGAGIDGVDFQDYDGHGSLFNLGTGTARLGLNGSTFKMINFENIWTGRGSDSITGTGGSNIIRSDAGNDLVKAGGGNDTVYGGDGNDRIEGAAGNDLIDGGRGNDTVLGGAGNDTFYGGPGEDRFDGGTGFDTLSYALDDTSVRIRWFELGRASGHDSGEEDRFQSIEKIVGSRYNDIIKAGATAELDGFGGNDEIASGSGANKLTGGAGVDVLNYNDSTAAVTVNLATNKAGGGWAQGDKISGFEGVKGSAFNDKIAGTSGANSLLGWYGDDQIKAGGGNDYIRGGAGGDSLWGGSGADRFAYHFLWESPAESGQRDAIKDFSRSQGDKIDLLELAGHYAFVGGAAFSGAMQVRFSQAGGKTLVEVNSTGNSEAEMRIELGGNINLQASDFML